MELTLADREKRKTVLAILCGVCGVLELAATHEESWANTVSFLACVGCVAFGGTLALDRFEGVRKQALSSARAVKAGAKSAREFLQNRLLPEQ